MAAVWIDAERCTGCGECLSACPVGAMEMVNGKAQVDAVLCLGCGACIGVCPVAAIVRVVDVDIVPSLAQTPARQQASPLVAARPAALRETARAVVVTAGTGLALRAAQALTRAVGRWLTGRTEASDSSALAKSAGTGAGDGRQRRHRQRGK